MSYRNTGYALIIAAFVVGFLPTILHAQAPVNNAQPNATSEQPSQPGVTKPTCPKISDAFKHGFQDPLGDVCVPDLVNRLIVAALSVAGSIFFVMFVWGGFTWLTAGGDPGKIKKATSTLVNAVIGMAIVFASYALVSKVIDIIVQG